MDKLGLKGQLVMYGCLLSLILIGSKLFGLVGAVCGGMAGAALGYGLVKMFKIG